MGSFERIQSTLALWQLRRAIATRNLANGTDNRLEVFRVPERAARRRVAAQAA